MASFRRIPIAIYSFDDPNLVQNPSLKVLLGQTSTISQLLSSDELSFPEGSQMLAQNALGLR